MHAYEQKGFDMFRIPTLRYATAFVASSLMLAVVLGIAAIVPASASVSPGPGPLCHSTSACFAGKNSSTGPGLAGTSALGNGITATTASNLNTLFPFGDVFIGAASGLAGTDNSSNATGNSNLGVLGLSLNGSGVAGATISTDPSGQAGVEGADANNSPSSANVGVFGFSLEDIGVFGQSRDGIGVFANVRNAGATALFMHNKGGGVLMRGFVGSGTSATKVVELDGAGNLTLAGSLTQNGTPMVVTRTTRGQGVLAYGALHSMATVEDFGEAQLANGQAIVRLDPAFASTLDPRSNYMVFITAQGETHGSLYVAQKSAQGFVVRETQAGRSNVAFDYRIVGRPFGSTAQRLPVWTGFHTSHSHAEQIGARLERQSMMPRILQSQER